MRNDRIQQAAGTASKFTLTLLTFFLGCNFLAWSQDSLVTPADLQPLQDIITTLKHCKSDDSIKDLNQQFRTKFEQTLQQSGSFTKDFRSLQNVNVVNPTDNSFRLYTWLSTNYERSAYTYYGFLQVHDKKTETNKLISLTDATRSILKPESEVLKSEKWFGAVYYSVIPDTTSGRTFYTLLGWKGRDPYRTQKIIDVLYFENGIAKFGYPLFKSDTTLNHRMIFTFTAKARMTLQYEAAVKMIVFDHLSAAAPSKDKNSGGAESGPDGSYDGFQFKDGLWRLVPDLDARNDWKPKKKLPTPADEKK